MNDYNISAYTREVMELMEEYIEGIFGKGEKDGKIDMY